MTEATKIIIEADGSLELLLCGEPVARVPAAQADWVRRLIDAADGRRAKGLLVTGIVAGLALASGEARA